MWALADPELNGYVGSAGTVGEAWPHLQQVCRLERQRVVKGKKQVDVSYAISSLPATDADARRLLSLSRGHWGIENRLHWVRDVTFDEDRSQVRTGAAPQVLAGLRNLVISLVRRALSLSDQLPASAIVLPGNEQPVDQSKGGIFRLPRRLEDSSTSRLGEGGTSKYLRKGATTSP